VSRIQSVARKTIPLCGIVLVLGIAGCGFTLYTPTETAYISLHSVFAAGAPQQHGDVGQQVVALIQNFLKDVPGNQRATFDHFFADDVIYTRGTGQVITKKDILADSGDSSVPRANATYEGEDFQVHQYSDLVVVNFRLVMHATEDTKPVTRTFRNTGTFMKRNGQWQAIAWQATPIAGSK
jgi:ketosteroid isomerase-like protein